MTEPTDAEIVALADATRTAEGGANGYILPISFARAVLAKWGTLRAENIVIPTDTMEQEFQKHYQRGYEAGKKAATSQPTQAADSVLEDAMRYRWLRDHSLAAGQGSITVELDDRANGHFSRPIFLAELDAAIDAARKQGGQHG